MRPLRAVLAVACLALPLAGTGAAQETSETASLRVLHLSPDAPLVDVVIEGRLLFRDLGLRDRSRFVSLPAGRHEIRVFPHRLPSVGDPAPGGADGPARAPSDGGDGRDGDGSAGDGEGEAADPADGAGNSPNGADAGAAPEAPEAAAGRADDREARALEPVTAIVELEAGSYTTLVLTGNFELPTREDRRGHLSLDVEPADANVTVSGPQGYRLQRSGDQFLEDLEPGSYDLEVDLDGYQPAAYGVDVAPGSTTVATVTLQEADAEEEDDGEPLLQQEEAQGTWRRLELQPYQGALPLPPASRSLVRIVHVAPIVPHLSVRITSGDPRGEDEGADEATDEQDSSAPAGDDAVLATIDRLAYPNASEYLELPPGRHRLDFHVSGSDTRLHSLPGLRLRPGFTYTLFVSVGPENGEIWVVPSVDAAVPQRPPVTEER